jgi:hypothetical protein
MNKKLLSEFKDEEIRQALDAIGDLKAPGPDSMPTVFYRKKKLGNSGRKSYIKCWVFFRGGSMPERWNEMIIACLNSQGAVTEEGY